MAAKPRTFARFHRNWLSPRLGFICFGFPCKLSLIVARPGFGFHRFRLSRGFGFDRFGFPLCFSPVLGLPWNRFRTYWFSREGAWMRNLANLRGVIGVGSPRAQDSYVLAFLASFRLLWLAPGLGFIGFGFPGIEDSIVLDFPCEVSPVLGLPWHRFRTYWFPHEGAWMRKPINCTRFHRGWLFPRLGFIRFGFPCKFSFIVARPGFGFHRFRLSRGLGFDRVGFPL